jgi:predicted AlkP superfamily pyrophosphatase or phosphodiesterase
MPRKTLVATCFAVIMGLVVFLTGAALDSAMETPASGQADSPDAPKLVVLVVFDQFRGDYPKRWQELYDNDGFGRLLTGGAWYQECHYPYAFTLTAAGHATLVTGTTPSKHGIIANDWYDRDTGEVGAVQSDRHRLVPRIGDSKKPDGAAPVHLKRPSVGDGLLKHRSKSKVVSLSIKDRSAILLAALRATACYWFNTVRGLFVTSTYYRDAPHGWVAGFNKQKPADKYFGTDWVKLRPDLDYAQYSGPDDVEGEGPGYKQGRTFPHPTTGGLEEPGKNFYNAVCNSPYGNELLLDFAKQAIEAEQLGQRDARDLLCLSFSSNDMIGHCWGPDSQEVLDMTLRTDLLVKDLLAFLDAKVGKGKYLLVVTADHGVAPLAEVARAQGKDAGRVSPKVFTSKASEHLQSVFAPGLEPLPWLEYATAEWIYLNHGTLKQLGLPAAKVEDELCQWLARQPGVQTAYGRTRLQQGPFKGDPVGEAVRLSYYAEHSGDVAFVLKPNYMVSGPLTEKKYDAYRATHGSPHSFDTHVPLLVYGPGVRPGVRKERVTPLCVAAILARALDVPPPEGAEAPVPAGLFK